MAFRIANAFCRIGSFRDLVEGSGSGTVSPSAVVELAKIASQRRVGYAIRTRAGETADFNQLCGRHVRLRLKEMGHIVQHVVGMRETDVGFRKRKPETQ